MLDVFRYFLITNMIAMPMMVRRFSIALVSDDNHVAHDYENDDVQNRVHIRLAKHFEKLDSDQNIQHIFQKM